MRDEVERAIAGMALPWAVYGHVGHQSIRRADGYSVAHRSEISDEECARIVAAVNAVPRLLAIEAAAAEVVFWYGKNDPLTDRAIEALRAALTPPAASE